MSKERDYPHNADKNNPKKHFFVKVLCCHPNTRGRPWADYAPTCAYFSLYFSCFLPIFLVFPPIFFSMYLFFSDTLAENVVFFVFCFFARLLLDTLLELCLLIVVYNMRIVGCNPPKKTPVVKRRQRKCIQLWLMMAELIIIIIVFHERVQLGNLPFFS